MKMKYLALGLLLLGGVNAQAQLGKGGKKEFTYADTLRGSVTPQRAWWDLLHYDLKVEVHIDQKALKGSNTIQFKTLKKEKTVQVDLQSPLSITAIKQGDKNLNFTKQSDNAYFVDLQDVPAVGGVGEFTVYYEGVPRAARNAPWDGGLSWKTDKEGRPFVATSCQGLGASVWWPCKDHMYDEPDKGMRISVTLPDNLMNISNGNLVSEVNHEDGRKTTVWEVTNPINNYGVNMNIGKYVRFGEVYAGEKGNLNVDYWVLDYNLEKAKEHFQDVPKMLKAFEHWFGPYPFYEDGYKLVEVPYLGMEHQSSVTYGNQYKKGYLGRDLSGTGWGLKWDYIIVHESGHEWFANNITYKDIADMWVHEGFTTYSEALFVDYHYGKTAGEDYVIGQRKGIRNDRPLIGTYNVNSEGSSDMYNKGANVIHTLRHIMNNDDKFRDLLRGLNKDFYHKTVTTQEIEAYIAKKVGRNLNSFFNQYLRDTRVPKFVQKSEGGKISYRWENVVDGFDMPLKVKIDGQEKMIYPTTSWKSVKAKEIVADRNFYIQ